MSSSGPRCQKTSHLKLISFVSVSSVLFLSSCGPWCQKALSWSYLLCFCLFCALSVFLWALVSNNFHLKLTCFVSVSSVLCMSSCGPWCLGVKNAHLKLICFVSVSSVLFLSSCRPWCQKTLLLCFCLFCALSVFLWALVSKNSHLKLICFASVSSVLFLSSCGPWCQITLILSWFALLLSLRCSFCLLVGLGVKKLSSEVDMLCFRHFCAFSVFLWALVSKNYHLKLVCFVSVSSVLFLSSCGPWCQKTPIFMCLSLLCIFCLLVGLGVNKLSLLCSFCLLVGLGVKKLSS